MGRTASADQVSRIEARVKLLTPERMNYIAGGLMGTGALLCMWGARDISRLTTADMSAKAKSVQNNIGSLFLNSIPFLGTILMSAQLYKGCVEARALDFKSYRNYVTDIRLLEAGIPSSMSDIARATALKTKIAQKTELEIKLIPYTRGMEYMQIGQSVFMFGFCLWCALHPDVVKEVIDATEKVTIRAIDESSEVIKEGSKGINDFVKALLPDLWGLGW